MSRRKPSKQCNSKRAVNREISRSCKGRNRTKDMDEIRNMLDQEDTRPTENPLHVRCRECDREMEPQTIEKHRASRGHKRRLKELEEDALLEQERRNGMF
ncbi:hypothetical protein NECID01_0967 [Nematocida sp. AWRm77]|nr:hypothetical protein NECID01_0967 [Nematocida sp. AWRm77]